MLRGPNDTQIGVYARGAGTTAQTRADGFALQFSTWASWRYVTGHPLTEAGYVQDEAEIELTINDTPRNRAIGIDHRVMLQNQFYAVANVAPRDRMTGNIVLRVTRRFGG